VIVVMHRREAITSTNTGRLAARVLEGAHVRVYGEPASEAPAALPEGRHLALFPREGARVLDPKDAAGEPLSLLVPDGTWSQARRLMLRDAALRGAEPVALPPAEPSRYRLRRHEREGALCTLEAIAHALGVLEGPAIEAELLTLLDVFVTRALRARAGILER